MQTHMRSWVAMILLTVLAAALRVRLLQSDLSIDEVWSLRLASLMHSPLDIFSLHSDNNHYLNTLWLYLAGPDRAFWIYRLPSFLCGVALVPLVMQEGEKKNATAGLVLGCVTAASALLTSFSAEARGYMPMIFFGFLSYRHMKHTMQTLTVRDSLLFALLSMVSFLWQLVYVHLFLALMVWFIARFRSKFGDRASIAFWISFLPAILLIYLLAVADFSHLVIGGGPTVSAPDMLLSSVHLLFGTPIKSVWTMIIALSSLVVIITTIDGWMRSDRPKALGFITLFAVSPILWLVFFHPTIIYPRYFIIPLLFALLLLAQTLDTGLRHANQWMRTGCMVLLCAYLAGNAGLHRNSTKQARGYSASLTYVLTHDERRIITIGSTVDFRTELLLWFYASKTVDTKRIEYLDRHQRTRRTPEYWFVDTDVEQMPETVQDGPHLYLPVPNAPSDGNWKIYRLSDA